MYVKFGKVKSFPIPPPYQRCGKVKLLHIVVKGDIGKDVEKKLFLDPILSTIIVKSKMDW